MKKMYAILITCVAIFTACEQPTDNNPGVKLPSLTIRNESSYVLTDVKFSGISFAAPDSNDLPSSNQSVKQLTADDLNKTGYITFTRKDIGIALRTEAISITDEDYTFTFTNNTPVEEQTNTSNKNSLSQISFLSKVAVERDGRAVAKNDAISLGEITVNASTAAEFTLKNTGVGKLLLAGNEPVKITGDGANDFSVVQPASSEIAPNGSLPFSINCNLKTEQSYSVTVTVSSNDQSGDFTFTITATGVPPKPIAKVFYESTDILQEGTIDAGEVLITQSTNITVVISNTGSAVLTLDTANITITGADVEAFSKTTNPGDSISAGEQSSFIIECKPTKQGENNAILTIQTNDSSRNPIIIYLKVTGNRGSGILELTQTSTGTVVENNSLDAVEFGRVEISSYQALSFTIKNTGNITLNLPETSPITSTNAAFAIQAQPVNKTLSPGASATFTIRFTPNAEGNAAASIDIPNDGDEGMFTFAVTGTGYVKRPQIIISSENTAIVQNGTIDAGEVLLTLSNNITVVIRNTGEEVLTVDTANITITGANAAAFTKITNPGGSISVGSVGNESSFIIKCEPVVQGENTATLTIPSNDINRNPVVVYLKVTGVKGSGIVELTQSSTLIGNNSITPVDFGRVEINTFSTLSFTIKNTGNLPLVLTGEQPVESSNADFAISSQPANKTLEPNDATTFGIRFTPTSEADITSTITIANNSDGEPFTFAVAGAGYMKRPQIIISYENTAIAQNGTIDVGEVLLTLSKNITVVIRNTGEEVLTVDTANITITGTNAAAFTKITNPGGSISVGSVGNESSFIIKCEPVVQGENTATLTIPSNDINRNPVVVYLKVTGVKGSGILQLTQNGTLIGDNSLTPFDFGRAVLNENKQMIFTIKNTGNIPLVLTVSPAVTSSSAVFTVATQPANTTINPEATMSFVIQYTPTAEQEDTASISIVNDSDDGLFSLHVKGTGYIRRPQISIFYGDTEIPPYGTINAGDVAITQSKDITVIIKNTGEELLTVDTANITITGEGMAIFTKTNPSANVSIGGQTQFVISCTPDTEGEYQATLTIPTNDSFRTPYIVYLQATAVLVIYQIGDTGPAGGIIFYDNGSVINGWRYLEASLTNFTAQWGPSVSVSGTGLSIGEGKQNTQLIVAALNQWGETGCAAQLCANLNINGFADWFLPSQDELNLMYQHRNTIGGFGTATYWSSSEAGNYNQAYYQSFSYGSRSFGGKSITYSVRAIRAF